MQAEQPHPKRKRPHPLLAATYQSLVQTLVGALVSPWVVVFVGHVRHGA